MARLAQKSPIFFSIFGKYFFQLVVLLAVSSVAFYFLYFLPAESKRRSQEKREAQQKSQEVFEQCMRMAEYEFRRENINNCWIYNHDALDCDLAYFEGYKIGETPQTKYKRAIVECQERHPANERLYAGVSPDYQSLLAKPFGNLTERDAIKKVLNLEEFKTFSRYRHQCTLRPPDVTPPSEENKHWLIRIFKDDCPDGSDITLNNYTVNALTGELTTVKLNTKE